MAGSSLFALLDDIATLLDDISLMSKVAAKKTASVLSDDLAVNAEQVTGMKADRELPVVWAVFKGSLKNKAILVPLALILNALLPAAVQWLLMAGGAYLCYEGFEAIKDKLFSSDAEKTVGAKQEKAKTPEEIAAFEKRKISGAVRTDFILSAEIIVITLNIVAEAPMVQQILTLITIAVVMTVGVYGIVAGIVRMDDVGLVLSKRPAGGVFTNLVKWFGGFLVTLAPKLMWGLSWIGTVAMFLVGGSFVVEGIPYLEHLMEQIVGNLGAWKKVAEMLLEGMVGACLGGLVVGVVSAGRGMMSRKNR